MLLSRSGLLLIAMLTVVSCRLSSAQAPDLRSAGPPIAIGGEPTDVTVGDVNDDGWPDLVIARQGAGEITVLTGDGTGRFSPMGTFAAGENPNAVALGDYDADGDLDAAVANHDTDYVTLLLNDGTGRFSTAPASPLDVGVGPHPHAIETIDLDGDGHLDLLVDDRNAEAIAVFRGSGHGTFATPGSRIDVGGDPYRGMALADVDGDGAVDLVTPNRNEIAVVLSAVPSGSPSPVTIPADQPFTVAAGDITGDGVIDLVTGAEQGPVWILRGTGSGRFEPDEALVWRQPSGAKKVVVGDLDGDGVQDAVLTNYMESGVFVIWGGPAPMRTGEVAGGINPWGLAVADLTGDGLDDIVVVDETGGEVRVYLAQPERGR
jgi:hypothetical protein